MALALPGQTPQAPVIPFRKATLRKRVLDDTKSPAATLGSLLSWELKSRGMLSRLRLLVSGSITTATADPAPQADWPWCVTQKNEIRDSSAGMLHSCKGYSDYMAMKYFKPASGHDLAKSSDIRIFLDDISSGAVGVKNVAWAVDIDIEANTSSNLGLVPNQNAAFKYVFSSQLAPQADVVTTTGDVSTFANLTFQPSIQYYTIPGGVMTAEGVVKRSDGALMQQRPPLSGILRQVFDENLNVPATGVVEPIRLRTGRVLRGLIVIARSSTAGTGAYLPRVGGANGGISRLTIKYGDDSIIWDGTGQDIITECYERWGETPPLGVFPVSFADDADGFPGADFRRDLLDTRRLTDLWIEVTADTGVGNIDVVHDELVVPRNMAI